MYLGNLRHQTVPRYFPQALQTMLRFLAETDFHQIPTGRLNLPKINPADMYCMIFHYQTIPWDSTKPERHRVFADVQFLFDGQETIGWAPYKPTNPVFKEYDSQTEVELFEQVEHEIPILLSQGDFLIADTQDIHRPKCLAGQPRQVIKVVGKVRSELLHQLSQ